MRLTYSAIGLLVAMIPTVTSQRILYVVWFGFPSAPPSIAANLPKKTILPLRDYYLLFTFYRILDMASRKGTVHTYCYLPLNE